MQRVSFAGGRPARPEELRHRARAALWHPRGRGPHAARSQGEERPPGARDPLVEGTRCALCSIRMRVPYYSKPLDLFSPLRCSDCCYCLQAAPVLWDRPPTMELRSACVHLRITAALSTNAAHRCNAGLAGAREGGGPTAPHGLFARRESHSRLHRAHLRLETRRVTLRRMCSALSEFHLTAARSEYTLYYVCNCQMSFVSSLRQKLRISSTYSEPLEVSQPTDCDTSQCATAEDSVAARLRRVSMQRVQPISTVTRSECERRAPVEFGDESCLCGYKLPPPPPPPRVRKLQHNFY